MIIKIHRKHNKPNKENNTNCRAISVLFDFWDKGVHPLCRCQHCRIFGFSTRVSKHTGNKTSSNGPEHVCVAFPIETYTCNIRIIATHHIEYDNKPPLQISLIKNVNQTASTE